MKTVKTFEEFINESKIAINIPSIARFKTGDVETIVDYLNKVRAEEGYLEGNSEMVFVKKIGDINNAHYGKIVDNKTEKSFYVVYWGLNDLHKTDPKTYEDILKDLTSTGWNFKIAYDNLHFDKIK